MRRFVASLMIVVAGLSLSGCDSGPLPTEASIAGRWDLTTVNGSALPVTVQASNPKVEIVSATWFIGGGAISTLTVERHTVGGTVEPLYTYQDTPVYTLIENELTIRFSDGSTIIGDINGNRLTIKVNGYDEVYQKASTP